MERLTERLENGVINVKYASQHETAIHRLVTIEDILGDEYDLNRLRVIMDAEQHGGLMDETDVDYADGKLAQRYEAIMGVDAYPERK